MPLKPNIVRLSQDYWSSASLQGIFETSFYNALNAGFESLPWIEARQSFYRQREVNLKHSEYFQELFSPNIRKSIAAKLNNFFNVQLREDFDVAAHKMIAGDYIGPHTDQNKIGETHRLTVTFNSGWQSSQGGVLLVLKDGSPKNIQDAWLPTANNGFLFEITDDSYHAVTPIVGGEPRFSLIFTFKSKAEKVGSGKLNWMPFPMRDDVLSAKYTASDLGVSESTFDADYEFRKFGSIKEFELFVKNDLKNAPVNWSYTLGGSVSTEIDGRLPPQTDVERLSQIGKLHRIPPIILVRRSNGELYLADGSHQLSYSVDNKANLGVVIYDEVIS